MDFIKYFQSYEDYFWEWENPVRDSGGAYETLAIPGATTIAYEKHIFEILEALSEDGIPPFGSLLLVMIASNSEPHDALAKVKQIIKERQGTETIHEQIIKNALRFLNKVAALPALYKQADKRIDLLQSVFKDCHYKTATTTAQSFIEAYKNDAGNLLQAGVKIPYSEDNFITDFTVLSLLDTLFPTTEAIIVAIQGLPQLPELDEKIIEESSVKLTGDLVSELLLEPKTFPVASLVQRLWSGLNIPIHHTASSNQPLGGISDLTNKGDFDKLLISEFAAEDEVFMSRIANNEALYIQREVPPESDDFVRIILIDSSLRNWGNTKIMAYAAALAIAKHPKTDINCRIFTIGEHYEEVYFETIDQVIDGLDLLSPKADAAQGLNRFFDNYPDFKNSEIFLIASEEALELQSMQKVLNDHYDQLKYILATHATGSIQVYLIKNKGRRHLQKMELPLDELWKNGPVSAVVKKELSHKVDEPYYPFNYPIAFPLSHAVKEIFFSEGNYYILTASKALYISAVADTADSGISKSHNYNSYRGGRMLFENISIKSEGSYALGTNEKGDYLLGSFYEKQMLLTVLNLNTKQFFKATFEGKSISKEYKLAFFDTRFYIYHLETEEVWRIAMRQALLFEAMGRNISLKTQFDSDRNFAKSFNGIRGSILKNIEPVCIDNDGNLHFNKHELKVFKKENHHNEGVSFVVSRSSSRKIKASFKNRRFTFPDGSSILRDKRGIVTLESSDPDIPKIYIPICVDNNLCMATDTEFTGNDYYYLDEAPNLEKIPISVFSEKYLEPFIQTIINHGN